MIHRIAFAGSQILPDTVLFRLVSSALTEQRVLYACRRAFSPGDFTDGDPLLVEVSGRRAVVMFSELYRQQNVDSLYGWISANCDIERAQIKALSVSTETSFLIWLYVFRVRLGVDSVLMNPPQRMTIVDVPVVPIFELPAQAVLRDLLRESGCDMAALDAIRPAAHGGRH